MHDNTRVMLCGPSNKQTPAPAAVPNQGHPRIEPDCDNTSAPPEVPGVGFYPHDSNMTEPFSQLPSSVPPFSHALPALHVNNLPTAPLSSELHSTDNPIDQALNPDLTTYLDTATHHTVNITNSTNSSDHGQSEDDAPSHQHPLPAQVHHGRSRSRSGRRGIRDSCTTQQQQFSNTSG